MVPTEQKALVLEEAGSNFVVRSWPVHKPQPGEVLIKVLATGLNPIDWKIPSYLQSLITYPGVIGVDAAGEVVALGDGVTSLQPGDKVLWQGRFNKERATFQQYALASAELTAKIPPGISADAAASVPVAAATAYVGLYGVKKGAGNGETVLDSFVKPGASDKYKGTPLVVLGGASAVGQCAIQFARASGFSPIITTASAHNTALLASLGATHVLPRTLSAPALQAEVAKITRAPVRVVYDAVSHPNTLSAGWALLAPRGQLIHVIGVPEGVIQAGEDGKELVNVHGSPAAPGQEHVGLELYRHLEGWLRDGTLKPNRVQILPNGLAGIPDGLKLMQENKVSGTKLIAHPHD